eukprot:TRINITY_DN63658_c0_g1_i1.p1 TRINITY_DN63658_c0_g1~~TRINITY_DN63658_c0_g1_i1.p1  ORF type:complete len:625 (+),score=117.46 TRINITY_DN63658_c0_g1_i1:48-1877(+)
MLGIAICLLASLGATAQQWAGLAKEAMNRGLKGYDLIDAIDIWYGHNSPQYRGPHQQLDKLGNKDGKVTVDDWLSAGLPKDHFHYFDKNSDGFMDIHEAHSWHQQKKPARTMNVSEVNDPPRGHLQPLGAWKDPLPSEGLVYTKPYPHPRDFWRKHMDGYLPAVLKGAQYGWPAMNWTREDLVKRFGWVDCKLEPKVESRGNDSGYADLDAAAPSHRLSIEEYLRIEEGKNMYVVSIIPQAMAWEVAHPSVLLCGSRREMVDKRSKPPKYRKTKHEYPHESNYDWMTHVFEANLWIASGRTRSQFHYDKEWNVNCLLSGKKRWFFMNPFETDKELQWSRGRKFKADNPLNNAWTDWVYLDPDRVDLIVQHKLRNMDYYELIQEAGDCIFIPYAMLHQVQKLDDGLQVAASWMFLPETIYDEDVCKDAPLEEDLPLAAMDTLYMYTGKGLIPQGYADPLNFVAQVRDVMERSQQSHLTLKLFEHVVTQGEAILGSIKGRKKKIKAIHKHLSSYAKDPAAGLTKEELMNVPLRYWAKPAAEGDHEGPLPCDNGQEYEPCSDEEFHKITSFVEEKLRSGKAKPAEVVTDPSRLPKNKRAYKTKRPKEQRQEL